MSRFSGIGGVFSRTMERTRAAVAEWPFVRGRWTPLAAEGTIALAVVGDETLAAEVVREPPEALCLGGRVDSENVGIERLVRALLAQPSVRYVLCAGEDPEPQRPGATLLALFKSGVDEHMRVVGAPGVHPLLTHLEPAQIEAVRKQAKVVDLLGCTDPARVRNKIAEWAGAARRSPRAAPADAEDEAEQIDRVIVTKEDSAPLKPDKAGRFVITLKDGRIVLEHYNIKDELLRVVEGDDARSLYLELIARGWVSRLDHAAYLGRELTKAERALESGARYTQDASYSSLDIPDADG